jgi:predicted amidohydrolase
MLITNATAYIDGRFHEHMSVRTLKGMLTEISPALSLKPGEDTLDLNGDYLLPGFVDVHTHAYMGMDTMAGPSRPPGPPPMTATRRGCLLRTGFANSACVSRPTRALTAQ